MIFSRRSLLTGIAGSIVAAPIALAADEQNTITRERVFTRERLVLGEKPHWYVMCIFNECDLTLHANGLVQMEQCSLTDCRFLPSIAEWKPRVFYSVVSYIDGDRVRYVDPPYAPPQTNR